LLRTEPLSWCVKYCAVLTEEFYKPLKQPLVRLTRDSFHRA